MITLESQTGVLNFSAGGCAIRDWTLAVEAGGKLLRSDEAELADIARNPLAFTLVWPMEGLAWRVSCEEEEAHGRMVIRSVLENHTDRSVSIGNVYVLDSRSPIEVGDSCEDIVFLPVQGHIGPNRLWRTTDPKAQRSCRVLGQFFSRSGNMAMQAGFLTFQRADTLVAYEASEGGGITRFQCWCDFAGWELGARGTTPIEEFTVAAGGDPYALLEAWADLAAERCSARHWEKPPIGWLGWSWVDPFTVERYEDVVLRNCEAIRRRLAGFGVEYIWVSIGNIAGCTPGDWLNWNAELFPDGPERFAGKLREMGFIWGLWCAPFYMCSLLEDRVEEFRDALLKNADGSLFVASPTWRDGVAGAMPPEERPCMYALDGSHPKTLEFLTHVFKTYREWGVRYYMVDFLGCAAGGVCDEEWTGHHDKDLVASPEVYLKGLRAVREAAGDDTYLLSCTGPTVHNAGIVDAARIAPDFGEGRALTPRPTYPATMLINGFSLNASPHVALQNQAMAYFTHRRLYLNDAGNVLTVDKPLTLSDGQIHATVHAMCGGPTMIGDDVDRMDEDRLSLIKKTLPRSAEVAFPIDLFDTPAPDHPKLFHRKVVKPWGTFDVLAVYNFTDNPLRLPVALSRLGLNDDAHYLVWEFWNEQYIGRVRSVLDAVLAPGTVKVYRFVEDTGRPALLGTDMHVLMGEAEIDECRWDAGARALRGRATRPAGERGNVFLWAPKSLLVANPKGLWIAKDIADNALIVRAQLLFEDGSASWEVAFDELPPEHDPTKAKNL